MTKETAGPAGEMLGVLRYLRREQKRPLRGLSPVGERIAADSLAGRCAEAWLYRARSSGSRPVVFSLHGGGFALGSALRQDAMNAWVRDSFDVHVVGVNYRLAPEHPAPEPLEDVLGVVRHVTAGGVADLAVDADRLCLMGFSAGACLAAAAALACGEGRGPALAGVVLHYPFLDAAAEPCGVEGVPLDLMRAYDAWYLSGGANPQDPLVSPLFASDAQLAGLPRVVVCPVEGDSLECQGLRFYERLRSVGADALLLSVEGARHGFIEDAAAPGAAPAGEQAGVNCAASLCELATGQLRRSLRPLLGEPVAWPALRAPQNPGELQCGKGM